jgi:hypothetical protein
MPRKTVTFTTPDHAEARQYHLEEAKAQKFAAKVIADGGAATIGPFTPGADLRAMLAGVGIDPRSIR